MLTTIKTDTYTCEYNVYRDGVFVGSIHAWGEHKFQVCPLVCFNEPVYESSWDDALSYFK